MKPAILDTGPIVAWLCPRDEHHHWARRAFLEMAPGSLVCEAVLTEVCHLVAKEGIPRARAIEFVNTIRLNPVSLCDELEAVGKLLGLYSDAPMDFADGCVVRLAEMNDRLQVCTVDSHFRFFRKNGSDPIALIAPFAA
jgi:predicted nucleic acid-binding protein